MLIVHVFIHVKPECLEDFIQASLTNARNSIKEPGITRFDLLQQHDNPTRFVLIEVYRTQEDPARHKQTAHYNKWKKSVAPMMAEHRSSIKYKNIFPAQSG